MKNIYPKFMDKQLEEISNEELLKITPTEFNNAFNALIFAGIVELNSELYKNNLHSYEDNITKLNNYYNQIISAPLKEHLTILIDRANTNYINKDINKHDVKNSNDKDTEGIVELISNIFQVYKKAYQGVSDTGKNCTFSLDISDAISSGKIDEKERPTLNKLFECYLFSEYLKKEYADQNIYLGIRKECIKTYDMLANANSQELLLKYVPKEFLKIK